MRFMASSSPEANQTQNSTQKTGISADVKVKAQSESSRFRQSGMGPTCNQAEEKNQTPLQNQNVLDLPATACT